MKYLFIFPLAALLCCTAYAERSLEKDQAKRTEVRYSQIGPRNTLLFYTYESQQAILKLSIDNKDTTFPISGAIYLFDTGTTAEDLAKWVNNQHSCGLYPEVPKPVEIIQLPEEICSVTKAGVNREGATSPMGDSFEDHKVGIAVKDHKVSGKFDLKEFKDQSGVFVRVSKN